MTVAPSLNIPVDDVAEEALAGVVASSSRGFDLAAAHGIQADCFYIPACRRVFAAARDVPHLDGIDDDSLAERLLEVSRLAAVPLAEVQRLRDCRITMFDRSGSLARRVHLAGQARSVMSFCDSVYSRLGSGERVDIVLQDVGASFRKLGMSA